MPSFRLFKRGEGDRAAPGKAAGGQAAGGQAAGPGKAAGRQPSQAGPATGSGAPGAGEGIPFDALTEEWRLLGVMRVRGRLSDVLNRRESLTISDVSWAPCDGSAPFTAAPGLQAVDPYDLVVVLGGSESLPQQSDAERSAYRVHKVAYDVALDCPPFRVVGTVHLHPGTDPERLLDRATGLFIPVTDAETFFGGRLVGEGRVDVALVNKVYLRGIEQLDGGSLKPSQTARAAPDGTEVRSAG